MPGPALGTRKHWEQVQTVSSRSEAKGGDRKQENNGMLSIMIKKYRELFYITEKQTVLGVRVGVPGDMPFALGL